MKNKEQFIIQLIALIVMCIITLAAFKLADSWHNVTYKMKLAELGFNYTEEKTNEKH